MAPELTPVEARRIAPVLRVDADRVQLAFSRLSAGRLDDVRLETQRTAAAPILGDLADAMGRGATLAENGQTRSLVALVPQLRASLTRLRDGLAAE